MTDRRSAVRIEEAEVHLWGFALAASRRGTRAGVRAILGGYVGLPSARVELLQGRRDVRPALAPGLCPGLTFNLSHSGSSALLAVARDARVGVDIEWIRRGVRIDRLIHRFFSGREAVGLAAIAARDREAAFFRTWVRKEAYLKAVGGGVPAGLRRFSVSVAPDEPPAILDTELEPGGVSTLSLYDLDVPEGYAGALAVEGTGHRIRYMSP